MNSNYQITNWCHNFIRQHVLEGDICIDATAGNGNDTELLCRLTGPSGKVYAFDIQEQALQATHARLQKAGLSAILIQDGHENMELHIHEKGEISCAVFNFGYLPGGDHALATQAHTSIAAVQAALHLLKKGGILSLCIYSGGDSGFAEKEALLSYLKELDSKHYLCIVSEYYNRPNHPPTPVLVVKL